MARRIPQQAGTESPEETPPMPGGSPGIEAETNVQQPHFAQQFAAPDPEELAKLPKPKVFRVVNGGRFVSGGMPSQIRPGSRVSESTHDLVALRHQGIQLEEIIV